MGIMTTYHRYNNPMYHVQKTWVRTAHGKTRCTGGGGLRFVYDSHQAKSCEVSVAWPFLTHQSSFQMAQPMCA